MSNGFIICLDGIDGSGKETQSELLYARLKQEGFEVSKLAFPNYLGDSSTYVKKYLNGEYGEKPDDVNPYVASMFFALDRYDSYKTGFTTKYGKVDWQAFLNYGGVLIVDRYVSANQIHQLGKIDNLEDQIKYLKWTEEFEHGLLGLPKADMVFLLNTHMELVKKVIEVRAMEGFKTGGTKDIHENDISHLDKSRKASLIASEYLGWNTVNIWKNDNGEIKFRDKHEINEEIYKRFIEVYETK